jgi:hypothetical protein
MIVLDEQLLGRNLEVEIAKWYRGTVTFITDLRPNTVIKDDAIPKLLRQQNQPTFVTINESDFWRKIVIDHRYCVVCFTLPDSRAREIPQSLRSLLRRPEFRTKAKRMGKVIRVTDAEISWYSYDDREVRVIARVEARE